MPMIKVLGANIRNTPPMRRWQVRSDYRKVRVWADVAMLNEIGLAWYKVLASVMFPAGLWWRVGVWRTQTPVFLDRSEWLLLWSRVVVLHEGRARTSPTRRVVVAKARHIDSEVEIAFVCTHWVSGAWNRKKKRHKAWRRVAWRQGFEKTADLMTALYDAGTTAVLYGDLNKSEVPMLHPEMRWLTTGPGILKMAVLEAPGGASVRLEAMVMDHDVETDHPMVRARLEIG